MRGSRLMLSRKSLATSLAIALGAGLVVVCKCQVTARVDRVLTGIYGDYSKLQQVCAGFMHAMTVLGGVCSVVVGKSGCECCVLWVGAC